MNFWNIRENHFAFYTFLKNINQWEESIFVNKMISLVDQLWSDPVDHKRKIDCAVESANFEFNFLGALKREETSWNLELETVESCKS